MCPPYVPPNIDTFYEQPEGKSTSPTMVYVENRQDRPFAFLETFYTEAPMANEEEYPTPSDAYDAKTFEAALQGLTCEDLGVPQGSHQDENSATVETPEESPENFHGQIDQSHHAQREAAWKKRELEAQKEAEAKRRESVAQQRKRAHGKSPASASAASSGSSKLESGRKTTAPAHWVS